MTKVLIAMINGSSHNRINNIRVATVKTGTQTSGNMQSDRFIEVNTISKVAKLKKTYLFTFYVTLCLFPI